MDRYLPFQANVDMDQTNPTTAANGFVALLDQNRKVDQWNVDNLTLDLNTLSSTDTDGDDEMFNPLVGRWRCTKRAAVRARLCKTCGTEMQGLQ